ncbi:MAG: glycosyltransferase family 2 protein [Bryobacteraceae bacterium]|jgi:cellulose synthase/poly-beta-1,6-N-acetylglucosamine synthase-like glycosyltransferase
MPIAYFALILSGALVLHIVAGYPLFLAARRGAARPPVAKDPAFEATVSAIVAVHNGETMIRGKLEGLLALDYPDELLGIIVVSDGSTDGTEAIVREFDGKGVTLLTVPRGGKAAALNRGLAAATGEIVFFTDVRQPLEHGCLRHLVANFADPTVGAVTGELHLLQGDSGEQADMDLYWRYEIWARQRHSEIDSLFTATGCIYAMRRALAAPLPPDTLTDDAILPLRAFFLGYRVIFDPAAIAFDYPAVAGTEFRRRFRTLAGLWQVHARLPELFTSRNRMRFHFLSHKFSRLLLPWLILVFFGAAVALPPSWFRTSLLIAGVAWLLLALSNGFVSSASLLKRLTSPARTFLVMNTAALASVAVFFVPATRLWTPTRVQSACDPAEASDR